MSGVIEHFGALLMFAFAGAFSPGPNNIMVTASGAAFGLAPTLPHIAGVTIGFAVMVAAFGLGLGTIFQSYPDLHGWVRIMGAAYLLYLAWRIAQAGDPSAEPRRAKPLSFFEAALFQWVNVKAWTLALGVIAAFTTVGGDLVPELIAITVVFAVATVTSLVAWCLFGMAIRRTLSTPRARRIFNLALALLLALSVFTLFI